MKNQNVVTIVLAAALALGVAYHFYQKSSRVVAAGELKTLIHVPGLKVSWTNPAQATVYEDYVCIKSPNGVLIVIPREKIISLDLK